MRAGILVAGAAALAAAVLAGRVSAAPAGWQYAAIGATSVPASVLRAAASIRLAIVDTGADVTVPALAARHPVAYDIRTGTRNVRDDSGHGTFVASLAAAVSGSARLLIVKAGSASGAMSDSTEAAAIRYAVDRGARIINLSLGGTGTSDTERAAIGYAIAQGVLIVAAAGNGYADAPEYPAALLGDDGLAVAASTPDGVHARFSDWGPWVSVAAPGDHVLGALRGGGSAYESGTSFASPLVAGAAALVWAADPRLTARQVVALIEATASGNGTRTDELGYGVIDVGAAVARAQELARGSNRPSPADTEAGA